MATIKAKELTVGLPFGIGSLTFIANEVQQRAAWSLYVEMETRIVVQPLDDEHGLLREAMTSLYNLFEITREILKDAGPEVADGEKSFGPIAIEVLNQGIRPFLANWHPKLVEHENSRPADKSQVEHEHDWEHFSECRQDLRKLQSEMSAYAAALALISGAKNN